MNVTNGYLDLIVTDKQTGEEWECSYDASYIESVTRKTGNFKQFEIFTTMLKSGLLKTSDSITLDLLTFEDLESMRVRRLRNRSTNQLTNNNNRRYLIVTYSVEFDKINYPLPLEYCGAPDPVILQTTIRKLEAELDRVTQDLSNSQTDRHQVHVLEKRIERLTLENCRLSDEVKRLTKIISDGSRKPKNQVQTLQKAIVQLEKNVKSERNSHHRLVEKLQSDKMQLASQLERLKLSKKTLKTRPRSPSMQSPLRSTEAQNRRPYISRSQELPAPRTIFQRKKSPRVKTDHDSIRVQRSRSASPRIAIVNENYWRAHANPTRNRSSSNSSKKSFNQTQSPKLSKKASPRCSQRASRTQSPCDSYSNSSVIYDECYPSSRANSANVRQLECRLRKLFQNRYQ